MALENSGSDVILPAELAKKIDLSKKQLAINEQELITLQKARAAQEYAVRELLKQKDELQGQILDLGRNIDQLTKSNDKLEKENETIKVLNEELKEKKGKLEKAIDEKEKFNDTRKTELDIRDTLLDERERKVAIREKSAEGDHKKIDLFKATVSEAIASL